MLVKNPLQINIVLQYGLLLILHTVLQVLNILLKWAPLEQHLFPMVSEQSLSKFNNEKFVS